MSGVANFLVGGKKSAVQGNNYGQMSPEEQQRLDQIESQLNDMFGPQAGNQQQAMAQSQAVQSLFANNLKTFLTGNGQVTPEQQQQASDFVDQTFTNPTQKVVDQNVADYQSQAQGRAAALGRNPNADIATQQAIAGEGLRQNIGLQSERGSRIQSATNDIYNRGLSGLTAGMQGSGFLNQLGQQAFQNQLGLLNARTGLADFYQKDRSKSTAGTQTSSGLLGNIGGIVGGVANLGSQAVGIGSGIGNFIGGSGGNGQSGMPSSGGGSGGRLTY